MIEILAQDFLIGYLVIGLGMGLGLLAVCIPRPRKFYDPDAGAELRRKVIRHEAAGSLQKQSKYSQRRRKL